LVISEKLCSIAKTSLCLKLLGDSQQTLYRLNWNWKRLALDSYFWL